MDLEKQPQKPVVPAEPSAIRASDADRDRIADILRDALAEGRLDAEEHGERVDAAYRAKTLGELEPLVQDLPAGRPEREPSRQPYAYGPEDPGAPTDRVVAVFSGAARKGRWRVGRRTHAFSLFGSVEIDLTEAVFTQRLTTIDVTALFGAVEVRVPENVTLHGAGTGVFGAFEVDTMEAADPEAPVVVVNGYAVFGAIEARPKRGKRIADLHGKLRKHLGT
ncbi:DUF1707 and DUF2154 domain-containing protein [Streptomyces sp. WAC05374]|uniref:DUF1707 SHOCT-like domain-containing protein n=1 Tax=Streptomyces sp. WAC05374 TaxID=2487420 RepID=UPI000F888FA8|nr:DUF1707 domain-containing protein [Streptomyces sp. WAC05374]RST18558.1 DUF1707 and DUF2154 domain-containing protein [Streptomyces sp. WAC05374]TDF43262.1 DUF1707 and DUF2154 domain-containing protein [Streptomyces sp. WAC05374]TDF51048.1 DUF1707 and DUF2154 domain-containing protein [Streptomyces sp. WAC05374]TDF52209.1 DUF1707 and DUF2154 domain-containing protein [Streptomyces sp. WAC05374]